MTIEAVTMYRARCDAPGCETLSCDYENGNNQVYDTVDQLTRQFSDTREGSLSDDYGWLRIVENAGTLAPVETHYCGQHTTWDDDTDRRVLALDTATDEESRLAGRDLDAVPADTLSHANITESENA